MNANISISFELILLINWILKNDKAFLNTLVKHSLEKGFLQELEQANPQEMLESPDQLYTTILEFLVQLEKALIQNLETLNRDEVAVNAVLPVIKKIDFGNLDLKTVWLSLQQTKSKLSKDNVKKDTMKTTTPKTPEDATTVLFEQLLKNWKPTKKEPLN